MATKYKRLPVPLNDETHELLKDLSAVTGLSQAKLIQGFIEEIRPVLIMLLKAAKSAEKDKAKMLQGMDTATLQALDRLMHERREVLAKYQGESNVTDD